MAITLADFNKIWSSSSPLSPYTFSDDNYNEGWNFIGQIPPSRQMWDFLQKNNDEKMQYLANNYLPLSGGTLTGNITSTISDFRIYKNNDSGGISIYGGQGYQRGAHGVFFGRDRAVNPGQFMLVAVSSDGNTRPEFVGKPDGTLTWDGQPLLPVGIVQAFAGTTIPNGWLLCDGSAVSRTTYANLFACIGTTYGSGDGSTTFNLPNLVDKFIEGSATAGTEKSAGLPNIYGQFSGGRIFTTMSSGTEVQPFISGSSVGGASSTGSGYASLTGFDASLSNSIYGNADTVQPPALTMKYIIKY